jgi:hypothetical protein
MLLLQLLKHGIGIRRGHGGLLLLRLLVLVSLLSG